MISLYLQADKKEMDNFDYFEFDFKGDDPKKNKGL